ncbi:trissin receptor-like [Acanthaster planci]|uniref:Trissin receptor-like n=1 Tax=Acanthaster planci TaxID=133434 RepID=A0A8B7YLF8_ACAPL|nr:trissin receptor-like [Acanthaster planci]XP_022092337.1 trissin receptor-like [Acanthaster planci]
MVPQGAAEVVGLVTVSMAQAPTVNDSLNYSLPAEDDDYSSSNYYYSSAYYIYNSILLQQRMDSWAPIVLFSAVFLIGVPANALVIFVLARNRTSTSNINMYLLNLAVVDFAFLLFIVPIKLNTYIVSSRHMWNLGTAMCKLSIYVVYVNMTVSILTLVALAINRYNAVMRPVSCRSNRSKAHAVAIIIVIWVVSLSSQSPAVVVADVVVMPVSHRAPITPVCLENWPTYEAVRAFKGVNFGAFYCVPLLVVSICYLRMARALQRSAHFTRAESGGESALASGLQRQQTSRRKVARMVHILVLAFALCMLPWHVLMFITSEPSIVLDSTLMLYLGIFTRLAVYLNSCLNPLLYSFFSQNFRANLRKSCACLSKLTHRKKIFTPIEVDFKEVAGGLDDSARTSATSGHQRSFTSILTRAC